MLRSILIATSTVLTLIACAGGDATIPDPSSNAGSQQLVKQADGSSTCNGQTCSWAGTSLASSANGAALPTYSVGASFASLDGCNTCDCTAQGIMCTVKDCGGSSSSSSSGGQACPAIARVCKDGSSPTVGPNCTQTCPEDGNGSCNDLQTSAKAALDAAAARDNACAVDTDCVATDYALSCVPGCGTVVGKAGQADWNSARASIEADQCAKFKADSCVMAPVACPAIAIIPKCINSKCTGGENQ